MNDESAQPERSIWQRLFAWVLRRLGGPARAHVVVLLAATLALDNADIGAVGANASVLQHAFGISKAQVGLLLTFSSAVGAVATLPFGWLVDRVNRTRLLSVVVYIWAFVMVVSGFATSYEFLLITRLALGGLVAVALPAIASLVGDYFPQRDRGRMYSHVLFGEIVGTGFGLLIAGELGTVSWRAAFWSLALPAPFIGYWIHRLPEPARDGASRIAQGQVDIRPASQSASGAAHAGAQREHTAPRRFIGEQARRSGAAPREQLVYDEDPTRKSLWWAVVYVLRVPTNIVLIIGSALGYSFFAALRTFGIEFLHAQYGMPHETSVLLVTGLGAGALVGVYAGGNVADGLIARGHLRGRVLASTTAYLLCAALFLIAFFVQPLALMLVPLILAAAALGAINPPLDAARLDIIHPHLWGRAEAVRTTLRKAFEAIAPLVVGGLAVDLGLRGAFRLMTIPLFVGGAVGLIALRTYARDAATADAYTERTIA